ncbi:unnamed protein product [Durusdinium trenchii]
MHLAMVFARRERAIDQTLCLTPEEMSILQEAPDPEVTEARARALLRTRLHLFLSDWQPREASNDLTGERSSQLFVGRDTHVGLLAGLCAMHLKDGHEVTLCAGRDLAVARAIKAFAATQLYLQKQHLLTSSRRLAVKTVWAPSDRSGFVTKAIFTCKLLND